MERASGRLRALEGLRDRFGAPHAARKRELVRALAADRLGTASQVGRLHEALCFLRAYPDDGALLHAVESALDGFAGRRDLRRHRAALADTGIAGTSIYYRFFWFTALWLAERWPESLSIDWTHFENRERLRRLLPLLLPACEAPALEHDLSLRARIDRLRGPRTTDAAFLVRRFAALPYGSPARETLFEDLDIMMRLRPGPGTPSRTRARHAALPVAYRQRPFARSRPRLRAAARHAPVAVRAAPPGEARALLDLARAAMVTRSRDLDVFETADLDDVRVVDGGDGLAFACFGVVPERRFLLDAAYGFLTLQSGVPVGYVLATTLFRSACVAYNVFETFRGAESARTYGRVLGMVRALFGCDAFAVDPYQLGHDNPEGLASGAWWFYYKLGFRPQDAGVRRLVRAELAAMRRDPRYRSSRATLQRLSAAHVFWYLGRRRRDILGHVDLARVGAAVSAMLAERFGADRERGVRACGHAAQERLGVRSLRGWTPGERLAWERWSPLVVTLPDLERWSRAQKRALVRVVRAKGGRRESDYVRLFDAHAPLRRAILRLAAARR